MTNLLPLVVVSLLLSAGPSQPRLGVNLAGPVDWNTELPFVDVFRLSRAWISQREGKGWHQGPPLTLDEHGYVTALEPGCHVDTPLCTMEQAGHLPAGPYTVLYDGRGTMGFWGAARVREQQPGRIVIDVADIGQPIWLRITRTEPGDPIRHIRVIMPGHEATYQQEPWRPGFLQQWRGVACIRFMDFMHTNDSELARWDDRPTWQSAHWTGTGGVPIEMMCDLVNRLDCDAWFCIPHLADDDFVRRFAELVKQRLEPQRRVYLEYSNEVWNAQFKQHRHAAEQGARLGFSGASWEQAWKYTARRSLEIFRIWDEVFGEDARPRLVRVLPTQAVNTWAARRIIEFDDAWKHADAMAIAPYFGWTPNHEEAPQALELGVEGVLRRLHDEALNKIIAVMQENKKLADEKGLALLCYEAGQHLVGVGHAVGNDRLTELFTAANRHPGMGELYRRYYAAWEQLGGGLMCHFSSVGRWSKWGSWGLVEYGINPQPTAKMDVTMETMRRWNER